MTRPADAQTSLDISGRWATPGFGSIVEFTPCANGKETMCGRILWLWEEAGASKHTRTDKRNPDRALRSRAVVGIEIARGLRQTAPGVWSDGALYNPDDGQTYVGAIKLRDGLLELKGCAMGVFCQTQVWRRAAEVVAAAGCVSR